jgi:hypothetical protein
MSGVPKLDFSGVRLPSAVAPASSNQPQEGRWTSNTKQAEIAKWLNSQLSNFQVESQWERYRYPLGKFEENGKEKEESVWWAPLIFSRRGSQSDHPPAVPCSAVLWLNLISETDTSLSTLDMTSPHSSPALAHSSPRSGSSKISASTAPLASISQAPSVTLPPSSGHPFDSDPAPKNQCSPRFPVKITAILRSLASPRISHTTSSRASSPGPASRATTPRGVVLLPRGGEPTSPRSTTPRFGDPSLGRRPSLRRAWSSADSEEGIAAKGNAVIDAERGCRPPLPPRDGSRGRPTTTAPTTPRGKKEAAKKRHAGGYNGGLNRHVHTTHVSHPPTHK